MLPFRFSLSRVTASLVTGLADFEWNQVSRGNDAEFLPAVPFSI